MQKMSDWLRKISRSRQKLDTPEKLRIYFSVMRWLAIHKLALLEEGVKKDEK